MRTLIMCTAAFMLLSMGSVFAEDATKKAEPAKKTEQVRKADYAKKKDKMANENAAPPVTKAICTLAPTAGNSVSGWVKFTKQKDGILVEAEVKGLKPNAKHGFHIHEFGDISATDGTATGGHFNPAQHDHAAPDAAKRHAGDFGNIETDAQGVGHYSRVDKIIRLAGRENNIIGRGIIVHADADDLTTQPTGNAGARIAQGVIGVAKSE